MLTLKEKGHNIDISHIVVHKINKASGQKITTLKLAAKELKAEKQELHFVADVRTSFQRKSKPTYGIFEDSTGFNKFHEELAKS